MDWSLTVSDWISLAGLFISIIGFAVTIIGVRKAKGSADLAFEAANRAQQAIFRDAVIVSFSSAVTAMEEIKRLHRVEAWHIMPERYASLRKHMILIVSTHQDLNDEHKASIQGAIAQFRELEKKVESCLAGSKEKLNSARLNQVVTAQLDKLDELLNFMRIERE